MDPPPNCPIDYTIPRLFPASPRQVEAALTLAKQEADTRVSVCVSKGNKNGLDFLKGTRGEGWVGLMLVVKAISGSLVPACNSFS